MKIDLLLLIAIVFALWLVRQYFRKGSVSRDDMRGMGMYAERLAESLSRTLGRDVEIANMKIEKGTSLKIDLLIGDDLDFTKTTAHIPLKHAHDVAYWADTAKQISAKFLQSAA